MKSKVSFVVFVFLILACASFVSAGIGIKWDKESAMVNEGEETCLSYSVYNPWGLDSNVLVGLGGNLGQVLIMQEANSKIIPAYTSSSEAIPIEFCFKVPRVYYRDCSVAGKFLCELKCEEEQKMYEGEVIVRSAPTEAQISGAGGSATIMSVSAPLRIRVRCNPHSRDYTLLYVVVVVISALIIFLVLFRKYRRPKVERDREKLRKLRAEIKGEKKTKRKSKKKGLAKRKKK